MANIKKTILKKKIGNVLYDLMVKTTAELVYIDDTTTLDTKLTTMLTDISEAKTQLATLIGEDGAGSITQRIETAITDLKTELTNEADATSLAGKIKALNDQLTTLDTKVDTALESAKTYTDAEVKKVGDKVTTLIGTDTGKSVRQIAADELVTQLIPENAKESLDTIQEISAWIQSHPDDAAAMNVAINNLKSLLGTIPEDATETNVVDYLKALIEAEDNSVTELTEAFNAYKTSNDATVATKARFIVSETVPDDLTESDLFAQIITDDVE